MLYKAKGRFLGTLTKQNKVKKIAGFRDFLINIICTRIKVIHKKILKLEIYVNCESRAIFINYSKSTFCEGTKLKKVVLLPDVFAYLIFFIYKFLKDVPNSKKCFY